MTPIAKALCTEIGQEVTELGIQVHGGMGYVEETGVAQFYRDARIASIYEGTNGIQAIDLVGRKLLRDGGATVSAFVSDMRAVDAPLANAGEDLAVVRLWLASALDELVQCSSHLLAGERKDPELVERGGVQLHDADGHGDRRLAARARRAGGDRPARGGRRQTRLPAHAGGDGQFLCRARAAALRSRTASRCVPAAARSWRSPPTSSDHRRWPALLVARPSHWSPPRRRLPARVPPSCCPGWPSRGCSRRGCARCADRPSRFRRLRGLGAGADRRRCANACGVDDATCLLREIEFCCGGERSCSRSRCCPQSTVGSYPWLRELGDSPLGESLRQVDDRSSANRSSTPNCRPATRWRRRPGAGARRRRCGRAVRSIGSAACRSWCRKSSCPSCCRAGRGPLASRGAPMTSDTLPFAVPRPTVGDRRHRSTLSRASHLLRRPQLRRARARDGHRIRRASRRSSSPSRPTRSCQRHAGAAIRRAPRTCTTRSNSWSRSARAAAHPGRRGAGARLRLRGRQRPDAARPAVRTRRSTGRPGTSRRASTTPRPSARSVRWPTAGHLSSGGSGSR